MVRKALIIGITGQDGSYLAEHLLDLGYEIHGLIRRSSSFNTERIDHLYQDPHLHGTRLFLHYGDLLDGSSLIKILSDVRPDEIYNLGAQSHVRVSFDVPEYTCESVFMGTLKLLEAVRAMRVYEPRIYQAASSEMFGSSPPPQNEVTPFQPQSPYAVAKVAAYHLAKNYRDAYNMYIVNGILFNHESPRRGETFVTKKICKAAARIAHGLESRLYLGNLKAMRDWGFAGDYVKAMQTMLTPEKPSDFVIATGEMHSVEELVELAFSYVGLEWKEFVHVDPHYFRPTEVNQLCGDAAMARYALGWTPTVTFHELVKMMMNHEIQELMHARH